MSMRKELALATSLHVRTMGENKYYVDIGQKKVVDERIEKIKEQIMEVAGKNGLNVVCDLHKQAGTYRAHGPREFLTLFCEFYTEALAKGN
jgi:hypothetical protein